MNINIQNETLLYSKALRYEVKAITLQQEVIFLQPQVLNHARLRETN